ncbi:PREDICTED: 5-hydroxytryptamine receptor 6 isoform X2 [Myotis davidii]|uniref:5-hydroxytryptamine receptor 6 isoform X2 n=1 Tax=Myotis davidii TaxID=225400 RepID=UPI000766E5F4|nr:PREDICTED: 5-hydroxytryptamine receptor 6 isoform X2 [Myotis davidii]
MIPEPGPAYNSTPSWGSGLVPGPGGSGWVAAAMCVVIALTAAANSLLIALICTQPALRNTSHFFLVSLFTSDLMVGLVVMPPAMLNALYGRWVLARGLCLLWAAFDVMCCSASILNLCLISLDRYLLILSPLRYKLRMTPARALALVLGAWTLAALASFLPLLLGWHELGRARAPAPGQCRLLASLPFVLVASGLTFFLPSGAICFTYCRILLAARKQALQVASLPTGVAGQALETSQVPRTPRPGTESADSRRLATKHSRKALKASLTLGILLGMFFVTWLPFFVANIAQVMPLQGAAGCVRLRLPRPLRCPHVAGLLQQHHEPHHLPPLHAGLQEGPGQTAALSPLAPGAPGQRGLTLHAHLPQRRPAGPEPAAGAAPAPAPGL